MTKNNFSDCLSWLLQHPHSFGNLNHISAVANTAIETYDESVSVEEDEMARLQLAPQSLPRPRLRTQLNSDSNALPTPAPSRPSEEPKPAPSRSAQKITTPLTSRRTPKPRTPQTNRSHGTFDDGVLDIDEIDLTGDITTSSFGEFGPATTLWREDSAARVEPLSQKKGKKRKSDEYESDLLSPRSSRKTTKVLQRRITTISPFRGSQTEVVERHTQEKISLTQTTVKPNPTVPASEDEFGDFDFQDMEELQAQEEVKPSIIQNQSTPTTSQRNRSRRRSNAVLDSDEDESDEAFLAPKIEFKQRSPPRSSQGRGPNPGNAAGKLPSVDTIFQSPFRSRPIKTSQSPAKPDIPRSSPVLAHSVASPHEPVFKSSATSTTSSQNLSQEQKKLVESFAKNAQEQIHCLLQRLERSKKTVDNQIMEEICEGGDASSESKERSKAIRSKITSAMRLQEEIAALSKLRDQREKMVDERDQLRNSGHKIDLDDPENVLTLLCSKIFQAKREIDAKELTIHKLLVQIGVSVPSSIGGSQGIRADSNPSPMHDMSDRKVLVASTQKPPQTTPSYVDKRPQSGLAPPSVQSIKQTPAPSRSDLGNISIKMSNRSPSPLKYASRLPEISGLGRVSQPSFSVADTPAPLYALKHTQPGYSGRGFSRTMASPTRDSFFDEDFEDDLADEDLYMAAEQFEQNLSSGTAEATERTGRGVLTEVSDNVRRVSPAKKPVSQETSLHAALLQHPWSKDVTSALKKKFHLHGFRHNQLEAINSTLAGKDTFVLMPTGGGKSLCYQLPAIIKSGSTRGVTIVVSPLLSLMQDQVDHLQRKSIQANLINGNSNQEERRWVRKALEDTNPENVLQLLYVTPEMLGKSEAMISLFEDLHKRKRLARIVIDEAHCVSQWGHDFRPDYKSLGEICNRFKGVPIMALTATATENVKVDVMHNLGMKNAEIFVQSFNRPNLTYEVRPKGKSQEVLESIVRIIQSSYRGQAGIIYCLSRKNCEKMAEQLREDFKIEAKHYHAGMPAEERINIQKNWQSGIFKVIVATIAFGMGIDKPDVRFVIHHTIPKSLEGYYQETGRAGRDGKRSGCYLFYGYRDTMTIKEMIKKGDGSNEQKDRQYHLLRNMVQFCENRSDCRRVQVLDYFNEHFDQADCKNGCDNCNSTSTFETKDFIKHARDAIRIVRQIHRSKVNVTVLHCVDVYRGSRNKKVIEHKHNELDEYGKGADLVRGDVERLFYRLITEKALTQFNKVNKAGFTTSYIRPGPNAREFESGRRSLKIQVLASPHEKSRTAAPPAKKNRKKTPGAGVAAAIDEYPASTNVSSPLQPRAKRQPPPRAIEEDSDDDDDFIVHTSDMEEDDIKGQDDKNDDALHDEISYRRSRSRKASELGPPITSDASMTLNPSHQHILDDFVGAAKAAIQHISIKYSLRQRPITDRVLREIGVHFPQTEAELQRISGMNDEIFKMFGPKLLELIKVAYNNYEAIMRAQEDRPDDPNHKTVIEIVDDDDDDDDKLDDAMDPDGDVDMGETESSHYFSADDEVDRPDSRCKSSSDKLQIQLLTPDGLPASFSNQSRKTAGKKAAARSRSGSSSWGRRGGRGGQRGGGSFKARTNGTKGKKGAMGAAKKGKGNSAARSSTTGSNSNMSDYVYKNSKGGGSSSRSGGSGGGSKMSMPAMPT